MKNEQLCRFQHIQKHFGNLMVFLCFTENVTVPLLNDTFLMEVNMSFLLEGSYRNAT